MMGAKIFASLALSTVDGASQWLMIANTHHKEYP